MTIKLKSHNEYMPANWVDIFEQEIDWVKHSYFTYDAAKREFWNRLPTIEQLFEAINSVSWNCEEKAKALNIPFAGYRDAVGGFVFADRKAYLWSSSENDSYFAHYVFLNRDNVEARRDWYGRKYAFSVRLLQDLSESSSLWQKVKSHMEKWRKKYDWTFKSSEVFWKMYELEMEEFINNQQ
jgi:hypothetical protein